MKGADIASLAERAAERVVRSYLACASLPPSARDLDTMKTLIRVAIYHAVARDRRERGKRPRKAGRG